MDRQINIKLVLRVPIISAFKRLACWCVGVHICIGVYNAREESDSVVHRRWHRTDGFLSGSVLLSLTPKP